jgi:tRNA U38,U39,U40 pseudouridine synthase TruA
VPVAYNGNQFSGCPYSYNKKGIQPTVLETQKIWLELVTPVLFLLKINYRIS